ncbi:MAG: DUF58 domain-containing protein [Gammaproteobacteria bacterium]|nr:DUF58 domain-containing protein [Gammaproteobacteria bacterium]
MLSGVYVSLEDLIGLSSATYTKHRRRKSRAVVAGERRSVLRGRGVDFDEVRLYQPGDDVRNIDWNVTARKRVPHTKVFTEERERPTLLMVDQTMSMFLGSRNRLKSVAAADIAARLAWRALNQRDRVGGLVVGIQGIETIKPFRSGTAVVKLLRAIADANVRLKYSENTNPDIQDKSKLWQRALTQLKHVSPAHHRIVAISDFIGMADDEITSLLTRGRHNDLQLVHVYDEIERTLPPSNMYAVTNGTMQIEFHSGRRKLRDEYTKRFGNRLDELRSKCLKHNVMFTSFSTDDDLEPINFGR